MSTTTSMLTQNLRQAQSSGNDHTPDPNRFHDSDCSSRISSPMEGMIFRLRSGIASTCGSREFY